MDNKYFWKYLTGTLALTAIVLWVGVFEYSPKFKIIACDVGQGDAILIVQGKTQILVDGGPNDTVLNCLNKYIPFWDREIELVVLTHPQVDHYKGLINIFKNYTVKNYLSSGTNSSNESYQVLKTLVDKSQAQKLTANIDKKINVGLIHLDILWPDFTNTPWSRCKTDPNDCSVVLNLTYKNFKALLTADIGPEIIAEISARSYLTDIDYLKVPHHGSKNGLTQDLLDATTPKTAVISVGKKNRYGHPSSQVLGMLTRAGTKVLRTDEVGDVVVSN